MQQNVQTTVKDGKLSIVVDLAKEFGPSSSGKTVIIATTGAAVEVAPGIKLGLNVYRKP